MYKELGYTRTVKESCSLYHSNQYINIKHNSLSYSKSADCVTSSIVNVPPILYLYVLYHTVACINE